jgi:hypothetical protein
MVGFVSPNTINALLSSDICMNCYFQMVYFSQSIPVMRYKLELTSSRWATCISDRCIPVLIGSLMDHGLIRSPVAGHNRAMPALLSIKSFDKSNNI